jgi:hypothetical protein
VAVPRMRTWLPLRGIIHLMMILLALLVAMLAVPAIWAWYVSGGDLASAKDTKRRVRLRTAIVVSAGTGFLIFALGFMAFALIGLDWTVLVLVWPVGLLFLGILTPISAGVGRRTGTMSE